MRRVKHGRSSLRQDQALFRTSTSAVLTAVMHTSFHSDALQRARRVLVSALCTADAERTGNALVHRVSYSPLVCKLAFRVGAQLLVDEHTIYKSTGLWV